MGDAVRFDQAGALEVELMVLQASEEAYAIP